MIWVFAPESFYLMDVIMIPFSKFSFKEGALFPLIFKSDRNAFFARIHVFRHILLLVSTTDKICLSKNL